MNKIKIFINTYKNEDLLKNNIDSKDLIYVCSASDGAEIYEKLYKEYNWENKISVICVNAHWFSLNYSILSWHL